MALQINFLSSNLLVINLSGSAASKFIINHARFWEGYIVSEAYEKKSEWSQVLFTQFVLNNNDKYLSDFKAHIQLTHNMIEEIANRFKIANETCRLSAQSALNMKRLLKCTKDVGQYYRLISLLDFGDAIDELRRQSTFAIVNDLIYNKKI